ncbi:MAG TPA: hypothetical protein VJM08_16455 [Anaerolineales bacterium]|nr:hypothetical protein [Anaerolineales bacterium]
MNFVQRSKETLKTETGYTSKPRGYRFWLSCFVLQLVLPLLFYYGYCWGWWGRGSLLLQYLFQCNCPVASEETRYPEWVDVIVPACQHVNSRLSPSGRLLHVQGENSGFPTTYLLDLETNERTSFTLSESAFYFLTDDLLYVISYQDGGEYILDRINGKQYSIQKFTSLHPNAYVDGDVNLSLLAEALREASDVFLIGNDIIVALGPEFPAFPEHNFVTGWFDMPGKNSNRVEQLLTENNITYKIVLLSFPDEVISPDGRFVARADGIYLVETGQKIVEGYSASKFYHPYSRKYFKVQGWTYDGRGVIYSKLLNPCLIETNFFIFDDYSCYYEVPQPVLKLKVPEEYLLPTQTP